MSDLKSTEEPIYVLIDASILLASNFNSRSYHLFLKHISNNIIRLILVDVIIEEIKKNIRDNVKELVNYILNTANQFKIYHALERAGISTINKSKLNKENIFNKFFKLIEKDIISHAVVLKSSEYCSLDNLTKNYFNGIPPFTGHKKEFIDGIILDVITNYAKKNHIKVNILSNDTEFDRFTKEKEYLQTFNSINNFLGHIVKKDYKLINLLKTYFDHSEKYIREEVNNFLSDYSKYQLDEQYDFESEILHVEITAIKIDYTSITVIENNEEYVTAMFNANIDIELEVYHQADETLYKDTDTKQLSYLIWGEDIVSLKDKEFTLNITFEKNKDGLTITDIGIDEYPDLYVPFVDNFDYND
jgi:hypothetical protein